MRLFLLLLAMANLSFAKDVYVSIDRNVFDQISVAELNATIIEKNGVVVQASFPEEKVVELTTLIHDKLHRCGGYIVHADSSDAQQQLAKANNKSVDVIPFMAQTIDQQSIATPMVAEVKEANIRSMIQSLANNYKNRYYKSKTGVASSTWIRDQWAKLVERRTDAKVELFTHKDFPQPSVILTIEGTDLKDEVVVLGGHADSIAGSFFRDSARAPGADDNASGIATLTETIRLAMDHSFKPRRTIQFMAYAAEEVGLLGSQDIAKSYKKANRTVVGVLQLDMTNVQTSKIDIALMTDFTSSAQNEFMGKLVDEYVKNPWGYSRCGYGCSDHASWTNAGFPASMPHEGLMDNLNHNIHTDRDTLDVSGGNANHAVKFAKLAVAYMVEMAN